MRQLLILATVLGTLSVASAAAAAPADESYIDLPSSLVVVPQQKSVDPREFSASLKSQLSSVLTFGAITTMVYPSASGAMLQIGGRF